MRRLPAGSARTELRSVQDFGLVMTCQLRLCPKADREPQILECPMIPQTKSGDRSTLADSQQPRGLSFLTAWLTRQTPGRTPRPGFLARTKSVARPGRGDARSDLRSPRWTGLWVSVLILAGCGASPIEQANKASAPAPMGAVANSSQATQADEAGRAAGADQPAPNSKPASPLPRPQLIRTANLSLKVDSIDRAIEGVQAIVARQQGDLLRLDDRRFDESRQATTEVRVPAEKLDAVLAELAQLGRVEGRAIQADDVTSQIVDAGARLRNLRRTEESLLELLKRSGSIRDVLAVTQQLSQIREQIEQLDAQLKSLQTQVAYSRIQLSLRQAVAGSIGDNPLTSQVAETWGQATRSATGLAVGLLKLSLWLLAYTPYWILIGTGVWGFRRWRRSRRAQP